MTPKQTEEHYKRLNAYTLTEIPVPPPYELAWITGVDERRSFKFRSMSIWDDAQQERIGILIRIDEVTSELTAVQLLNGMFNDMHAPLTAIKGYAEILRREAVGALTEKQRELVTIIGTNADALAKLRNDTMDTYRQQMQRAEIDSR
jgi:signal transduction histidine kinase